MLTPKEISEKTFDKTFSFGYRMDDVDAYLAEVSKTVKTLIETNESLEKKLEILGNKVKEYRDEEDSLRSAIISAQKLGDSVIRESKTKAEIIMRDANIKAEALVNNAKRQIDNEKYKLDYMQSEVAKFKNHLLDMYQAHLSLIQTLPGEELPKAEQAVRPVEDAEEIVEKNITPFATKVAETVNFEPEIEESVVDLEEVIVGAEDEDDFVIENDMSSNLTYDEDEEDNTTQVSFSPATENSKFGTLKFGENFKINKNGK